MTALLRSAVEDHGGRQFSHGGDGIAAVFDRAGDAVAAACAAQRALAAQRWPEPIELRVRMGLHTGVAEMRDGNYFGTDVNRAARVMSLAEGGEVLATAATASLAGRGPWALVALGSHRLRGFDAPEPIVQVVADGSVSPERVRATLDEIGNLPRAATELIGRVAPLARVLDVLEPGALVTLVGPGGVGKTQLALAASRAAGHRADGAWFVDLTAAVAAADVLAVTSQPWAFARRRGAMTLTSSPAPSQDRSGWWCSTTASTWSRPRRASRPPSTSGARGSPWSPPVGSRWA